MSSTKKINVGVLGATGTVGQRFILLLASHPYFYLHTLGASPRSAGSPYDKVVKWKQVRPIPEIAKNLIVRECKAELFKDCTIVFSGLDAEVAGEVELEFRAAELAVFSNAKNHRRDPAVPLIVPLVNAVHLCIIPHQRSLQIPRLTRGFIVANANCSTTGLVVPLAALEKAFGPVDTVMVSTMQAISGAGYPGVPSLDIMDNVVPFISGEEEKMEWETAKILGGITADGKGFDLHETSPIRVSASCTRVPVIEGHTETVSVRFTRRPPPSIEEVRAAMVKYTTEAQELQCPSAPVQSIYVHDEPDRPQPRLDRDFQAGAGVNVGRIRECPVMDIKFVVLVNNVALGAATSSIINAELAVAKGVVT
ncbi:hypothetical protein FRB96_008710 [Tulasnella sp. 330]|nr:hypothetical protein FRB96_008710 [Tulasnella sp. 330]KAG8881782.1 hypothetical protein FRB97_009117 [Tulasnella sp. 331]KAG8887777.1 hypothetical protein FRB98_009037 [Tulasnella sp. 332]